MTRAAPLCAVFLLACAGNEATSPEPQDVADGGAQIDAAAEDATAEDAAAPDAIAADAGATTPDASPPADASSESLLDRWFRDYNAGLGTDYLSLPITTNPSGDPRYATAPAHVFHQAVRYGPRERNQIDFWQVVRATPAPVAVFIHGGGFQSGTRDAIHQDARTIPRLLAAGVSVATISYRWAYRDPRAAVLATNPDDEGTVHDVNGTRLDFVLRDCARAIQFIRYRAAEWNVDRALIGAWGGSAGAGCAAWTGAIDDLAVRDHADPVLRESSRLRAVGHTNGQPTYNWPRWPELLEMDETFVMGYVENEAVRLTQLSLADLALAYDLNFVLDYYEHLGPGDAAFYTQNSRPDSDETTIQSANEVIHHPRAHVALYRRCTAAGLDCEIETTIQSSGFQGDVIDFLIAHLAP